MEKLEVESKRTSRLEYMSSQKSLSLKFCNQYKLPTFGTQPPINIERGLDKRQPTYLDSLGKARSFKWRPHKEFYKLSPTRRDDLNRTWQCHPHCGVSTLMGFNGNIHIHGVNFGAKHFKGNLNAVVESLFNKYPILKNAHRYSTPSGGIRILVASKEPLSKAFGANNGFALAKYQQQRCGEILSKNGGHTLMPGAEGYVWQHYHDSIVIVDNMEDIFFPVGRIPREIKKVREYLSHIDSKYADNYDDWIRVGMAIHSTSPDLLDDWIEFSRQSDKFEEGKCEEKWRNFDETNNGELTAGTLYQYAIDSGWVPPAANKVVPIAKSEDKSTYSVAEKLDKAINNLIEFDLAGSELDLEITAIATEFHRSQKDIWSIYSSKIKESELEDDDSLADTKQQIDQFLNTKSSDIRLENYLEAKLAAELTKIAHNLNVRHLSVISVLLTTVATLLPTKVKLSLLKHQRFYANSILFSAIVGVSGSGKSPLINEITRPLMKLQKSIDEQYDQKLFQYQEDLRFWKSNKKEVDEPIEPAPPREYFVSDFTPEALAKVQNNQANNGVLILNHELEDLFKQVTRYNNNGGVEKYLTMRDGEVLKLNRATKPRVTCHNPRISLISCIQPAVLKARMGDFEDSNGFFARFIFCNQPIPKSIHPKNMYPVDNLDALSSLYSNLASVGVNTFKFDDDAQAIYDDYFYETTKLVELEPRDSKRSVLSKSKKLTGEISLILHCLNQVAAGNSPPELVSAKTLASAIALTRIYLKEVDLIQASGDEKESQNLTYAKIIELSKRKGWLKARDVQGGIWDYRQKSNGEIRTIFNKLVSLGYGRTRNKGKKLQWHYRSDDGNGNGGVSPDNSSNEKIKKNNFNPSSTSSLLENKQGSNLDTVGNTEDERLPNGIINYKKNNSCYLDIVGNTEDESLPYKNLINSSSLSESEEKTLGKYKENKNQEVQNKNDDGFLESIIISPSFSETLNKQRVEPHLNKKSDDVDDELMMENSGKGSNAETLIKSELQLLKNQKVMMFSGKGSNAESIDNQVLDLGKESKSDDVDEKLKNKKNTTPPFKSDEELIINSSSTSSTVSESEEKIYCDNPKDACRIENDNQIMVVDESRLDLFRKPKLFLDNWQPSKTIIEYQDARKLYLDIETDGTLDPKVGKVIAVGLMFDYRNKTKTKIIGDCAERTSKADRDEKIILTELIEILNAANFDILIGHNLHNFDFPFLAERCNALNISHRFIKKNKPTIVTAASFNGKNLEFTEWRYHGVQTIDTFVQACYADKQLAILPSYRLKDVAIAFGVREERRLELEPEQIAEYWQNNNLEPIIEYLKYDLEDTKGISDRLTPVVWYQKFIVPKLTLQQLSVASPALKWELLLESFYPSSYRPIADEKIKFEGAMVTCNPGLYRSVYKLDVSSMYPSIILNYELASGKDTLKHGLRVLKYLKEHRLKIKKELKSTNNLALKPQENALKILINGYYGFFGTGKYAFNDMKIGALVTAYGRQILKLMHDVLIEQNVTVIEQDTDGIICCGGEPQQVFNLVQAALPKGIDIDLDFVNYEIYVPKAKNYLLFKPDGSVKKVGLFRKRNRIPLFNQFTVEFVKHCLNSTASADEYYQEICARLDNRTIEINLLKVTQRIPKSDKKLTGAGIGKHGDKVTYYWGEQLNFHKKTNKQIKSTRVPVVEGDYFADWYCQELTKLQSQILQVIN